MRKRLVVMCAVSCMAVMAVAGNAWAAGNSDAAQSCQKGGYLTVGLPYGMTFKNTGDCVSYFAQNKTAAACAVTATTGCLTFDNVVLTNGNYSVTVNAAYSFVSTCNELYPPAAGTCPTSSENNYATGGGTYVITDPTGAVVEQGTFTSDNNPAAAYQGLVESEYSALGGITETTCAAAAFRVVDVYGATNNSNDPYVGLGVSTFPGGDTSGSTVFVTIDGLELGTNTIAPGVTLSC